MQDDGQASSELLGDAGAASTASSETADETVGETAVTYTETVGVSADSPAYVYVVNASEFVQPFLVPLGLLLFAAGIIAGALLGKALNWWKW